MLSHWIPNFVGKRSWYPTEAGYWTNRLIGKGWAIQTFTSYYYALGVIKLLFLQRIEGILGWSVVSLENNFSRGKSYIRVITEFVWRLVLRAGGRVEFPI
jgi:hypothetical protein